MSNTLEFDELKKKNIINFTLGKFKEYFGLKEIQEMIPTYKIDGPSYEIKSNVIMNNDIIYNYLTEKVIDCSIFNSNHLKEEITNFLWNLNDEVEQINKIRIPSSHDGIMDIQEAETTINYLLFNKKMLFEITI